MTNKRGKRDKMIGVWCSPKEHAEIVKKSEEVGVSKGRYCRQVALGEITQEGEEIGKRYQMKELITQVNIIGSNLNQVRRVANQTGAINEDQLEEIGDDIRTLRKKLMAELR